ncbi:MAG TPA: calcium-binding protein, partial [Accumulibacter sp.]|nr:calcium-binding protein [Accumulibacter sp.]
LLYAGAGSATLNGAAGNDNLIGSAGVDVLDGGSGADSLSGGDGNDYYFVDNVGDVVVESNAGVAGGNDVVYSALAAYTLGANVEIGRIVASGAASLTGNGLANLLYAGSGDNVLSGGAGNDTLIGGSGADTFRFDTAPNGTSNLETIGDFSVVDDTIVLENAVFTSLLASGPLAAGAFRAGAGATSAADTDDYLIYNTTTGALYYDAAGNTGDAPVQIALLGSGLALTSADFFVS